MALDLKYITDDVGYQAGRWAKWTGLQAVRGLVNLIGQGGTVTVAKSFIENKGIVLSSAMGGLVGVGASAGINAYLSYKDYEHAQHQMTLFYRDEIAAKLKKAKVEVTVEDLKTVAEMNPTLQQELKRERRKMRVHTGVALLGTLTAYGAVVGVGIALGGIGLIGGLAVAVASSWLAGKILEPIAEKVFSLDKATTVDRVRTLEWERKRGRSLSQEKVLSVYVAASPHLDEMIKKDFGRSFDNLSLIKQHEAVMRYGPALGLEAVTKAINEGEMSARELTFSIHGDRSGAHADPSLRQQAKEKLAGMRQSIAQGREKAAERWNEFSAGVTEKAQNALETGKGWVSSLGLKPKNQAQSWVDQTAAGKENGGTAPVLH